MWRADSLEKTLMLGKIEGRRRRGWQRVRWLSGITDSMDMGLGGLQASLSFTISQSLLKFLSIESVMPYNHLTLCHPLLLLPLIFPSTRYFQMNWLFASGGQSIGVSASVLPLDIQDWFPEYWHSNFEYQIFMFRNRISMHIDIPVNIQDWLV